MMLTSATSPRSTSSAAPTEQRHRLPTPSASRRDLEPSKSHKRKRASCSDSRIDQPQPKKPRDCLLHTADAADPVAHWVVHSSWPLTSPQNMSTPKIPSKRSSSNSTSSHWSELQRQLNREKVFAEDALSEISPDDDKLIEQFSQRKASGPDFPRFPASILRKLCEHLQNRNEASVQAYILPQVVPSPILLRMNGMLEIEGLDEEYNAEWIRSLPFLDSRPKPDYVVGLSQSAFGEDEFLRLQNYATAANSAFVTPNICYPFLICEVKSSQVSLVNAERQSLHAAAIAVRAIFSLYEASYGKDSNNISDLEGRLLVFSVMHDHKVVRVHGHYAIGSDAATRKYYRHDIATTDVIAGKGWQLNPYNFVHGIYETFAPLHIERIRNAIAELPVMSQVISSSEVLDSESRESESLQEPNAPPNPDEDVRKRARRTPVVRPAEQAQLKQQLSQLIQQLDEQRRTSQEREGAIQRQLQEQKELREQMQIQLQQQKEQGSRQQQQLEKVIDTLKVRESSDQ